MKQLSFQVRNPKMLQDVLTTSAELAVCFYMDKTDVIKEFLLKANCKRGYILEGEHFLFFHPSAKLFPSLDL